MGEMKGMVKYKDPVCGKWIASKEVEATVSYKGENYYFCSQNCSMEFTENPENYLSTRKREFKMRQSGKFMKMNGVGTMKDKNGRHHGCRERG